MPNSIVIKISHLTKIYKLYDKPIDRLKESLHPFKKQYHKEFYALNDINFEIKKGETVGIIGKNGAGKSTLLKIITGVLSPTSGSVHVNGRIASLLELGAGFNPEYTGIENIFFHGSLMGYERKEIETKIDAILSFADIGDFIKQPVKMYSSGMFARLAFAVAINVDPDILIVDEALSVGDAAFQRKCFARMETIREHGTTIVFVSHSERQIVELCNRAIFVHAGQLILDGEPKRVTGLYSKMMNSSNMDIEAVKEEFKSPKAEYDVNLSTKVEVEQREDDDFKEYFDESLISQSVIDFEENGAKFNEIAIVTAKNKKINHLMQENQYKIIFSLELLRDFNNIRIGITIKDIQGIIFAGAAYESGKHENQKKITKGVYTAEWLFECLLVEGVFIIDVTIINLDTGLICHRINDSYMFKVSSKEYNSIIQGKVPMFKKFCLL